MKNYIAELIGTFALVFFGTGAIIVNQQFGGVITNTGIAFTFGIIIMMMIYCFGSISGGHFNPAVTIAFTVSGRFPVKKLPAYITSQLLGAITASLTLKYLFASNRLLGASMPSGTDIQSFLLELILTFFLMLVILSFATGSKEKGAFAGFAIGAVVGLDALVAGPICGASMNPARSIGPALASGHLEHLWIYIFAPVSGAILATPVWKYLHTNNKEAI